MLICFDPSGTPMSKFKWLKELNMHQRAQWGNNASAAEQWPNMMTNGGRVTRKSSFRTFYARVEVADDAA